MNDRAWSAWSAWSAWLAVGAVVWLTIAVCWIALGVRWIDWSWIDWICVAVALLNSLAHAALAASYRRRSR